MVFCFFKLLKINYNFLRFVAYCFTKLLHVINNQIAQLQQTIEKLSTVIKNIFRFIIIIIRYRMSSAAIAVSVRQNLICCNSFG